MLKINHITIKNFRQFRNVELSFEDDKGIFLFIGKNGMGKSNMLNAICWCLYEEQPFGSDRTQERKDILNDEAKRENAFDEVLVEIEVEQDGKIFLFRRTMRKTQNSSFDVLRKVNEDWKPIPNPNIIANSFLPNSIRRFFIFEGEDAGRLFTGDYAKNLKESVWRVSDMELLDRAYDHLDKLSIEFRRKISKDNPKTEELNEKLISAEEQLENKIKNKKEKEEGRKNLTDKIIKFKEQQAAYSKYRELHEKRSRLEEQRGGVVERIDSIQEDINKLVVALAPFVYLKKELITAKSRIGNSIKKGEIPPKIKSAFVTELIEGGRCICGNVIKENSDEHKHLKRLLDEIEPRDRRSYLVEDSYEISSILSEIEGIGGKLKSFRSKKAKESQQQDKIERELKDVREQLKDAPDEEVGNIEKTIEKIEKQKDDTTKDIGVLEHEITKLKKEKEALSEELSQLSKKLKQKNTVQQKYDFIISARDYVDNIRESVTNRVRKSISSHTDKYFNDLMWKDGEFEKINFEEDYEVSVFKRGGEINSLKELSTGEKKVLGYATIKALTELSGFKPVPLFIDGPLENLDMEVKANFLKLLKDFAPNKQVFIFSLDGNLIEEFGENSVKEDNFYRLTRSEESTSTSIKPYHA